MKNIYNCRSISSCYHYLSSYQIMIWSVVFSLFVFCTSISCKCNTVSVSANWDLVDSMLPKTTRKELSVSTAYSLLSDLTVSFPKTGTYRITAAHNYTHAVPQGIIISRSNSDYSSTLNNLAKEETTNDVAILSTSVTVFIATTSVNFYIWAKSKTANSNQLSVTVEYLGD